MPIALSLAETKSSVTLSNEGKVGNTGITWDEMTMTWDEQDGTWDYPKYKLTEETKSSVALSNESK